MTQDFVPKEFLNSQNLPPQELKQPSFCSSAKAAKIEVWVNSLQATKITQTSLILYKSIPELNQVKTGFDNRLKTLESIRPKVQDCIEGLTQNFLHQPLILSEEAQKVAIVSQAMQKNMVDGYLLCAREICNLSRFKPQTLESLAIALHRAITGIGLFFFRTYQLYTQTPRGMWSLLNGLYRIAKYYDLLGTNVNDPHLAQSASTTVQSAWLRVVMLATCRSNQLNQNDVAHAYNMFAEWASLVKVNEGITKDKDNLYVVNLSGDDPPCDKSRLKNAEPGCFIELDFKTILAKLDTKEQDGLLATTRSAPGPNDFPDSLLDHLIHAWSNTAERKLDRREVSGVAEVCVGLIDCHYFLAGKQNFDDYLNDGKTDPSEMDLGASAFTPAASAAQEASNAKKPTWKAAVQNISTGGCRLGYRLLWKGDVPPRLQSGEVICLSEPNRQWKLGVVRWIKQLKSASQLGIQILSNNATICGIAQIYDMGGYSSYARALLLPASSEQPASILTPRTPFSETQKVKIIANSETANIRLEKCLFSTGSFKQFTYQELAGNNEEAPKNIPPGFPQPTKDFDSSWDDI